MPSISHLSTNAVYPSLEDRVAVVTGGATGIGESVVRAFAAQGAKVVFLDIQTDAANELITSIARKGDAVPVYYRCDLADSTSLQSVMDQVCSENKRIDVLINNAGNDTRHDMQEVTSGLWDQLMAVNLKQQFFMVQAVSRLMQQAQRGSIINMSSIAWMIPSTRLPVYVTAKAAVVGLTRTLAHELGADNIRVNCVLPGAIMTERQRALWYTEEYKAEILARQALKRILLPEEVARLLLFLAADDSSAITNQSFIIDGGWV